MLDGTNYAYWKARMTAFLKLLDSKSWKFVIVGWTHPEVKDDKGESQLKIEIKWVKVEDEATLGNSLALNAIFNGVDHKTYFL